MIILRILIILVVQTAVLLFMVYERAETLQNGKPVMLKTEPVDPRSLFRGYYVDLNYDISSLEFNRLEGDSASRFEQWDNAYVALEQRSDYWSATGVYKTRPTIIGDQVILKGVVNYITDDMIFLDYGIESYFIPEGDGASIEGAIREGEDRVRIEASIDEDGRAAIKGLHLDGELLYSEPPY